MKKQLSFAIKKHGGRRAGAGRKNRSGAVAHTRREAVTLRTPLHITLKLRGGLPNLRCESLLGALKESAVRARNFGLNVVHFSMQSNHIHLVAEAHSNLSLARGMRSLAGRFGKTVRAHSRRYSKGSAVGRVFLGRYHMRLIRSPLQMRNVLRYVLLNFSKHSNLIDHLDEFSTAAYFRDWKTLLRERYGALIQDEVESMISSASASASAEFGQSWSWLCRVGWRRVSA